MSEHHAARQPARRRPVRRRIVSWALAAPAAVALVLVLGYPVADGVRLSFSDWHGVGRPQWLGLDNYLHVASDPLAVGSFLRTVVYAAASAVGIALLATVLAAAISRGVKGAPVYRVVWFLPSVAPAAAVAVFWSTAFQPDAGAVNGVLGLLGLGTDHAWLSDPDTAMLPVVAVTIWAGVGFAFLIILGAMEQVPVATYEAASLDGASALKQFSAITLPLTRPVILVVIMLEAIWAANGFSVIWGMTQGGPGSSTSTLAIYVYQQAFTLTNFGVASAAAVLGGVALLLLGLICMRLSQREDA